MRRNLKFVLRGLIVALSLLIVGLLWLTANLQLVITTLVPGVAAEPTLGPTPPPPSPPGTAPARSAGASVSAPRSDLPAGHAGLEEWAAFSDGTSGRIGSGFLLTLESGTTIGVTTAHSLVLAGWPGRTLSAVALRLPQAPRALVNADVFYGRPGRTFTGYHFDTDYALLKLDEAVDASLALQPDPRGAPEPGERVALYSGLGDGNGRPRVLPGTVTAVSAEAIWVQMDDFFDPGGMSGSPLLSTHTGRVVGMAVSGGHTAPLRIGFHPIGSIVAKALAAADFPFIAAGRP